MMEDDFNDFNSLLEQTLVELNSHFDDELAELLFSIPIGFAINHKILKLLLLLSNKMDLSKISFNITKDAVIDISDFKPNEMPLSKYRFLVDNHLINEEKLENSRLFSTQIGTKAVGKNVKISAKIPLTPSSLNLKSNSDSIDPATVTQWGITIANHDNIISHQCFANLISHLNGSLKYYCLEQLFALEKYKYARYFAEIIDGLKKDSSLLSILSQTMRTSTNEILDELWIDINDIAVFDLLSKCKVRSAQRIIQYYGYILAHHIINNKSVDYLLQTLKDRLKLSQSQLEQKLSSNYIQNQLVTSIIIAIGNGSASASILFKLATGTSIHSVNSLNEPINLKTKDEVVIAEYASRFILPTLTSIQNTIDSPWKYTQSKKIYYLCGIKGVFMLARGDGIFALAQVGAVILAGLRVEFDTSLKVLEFVSNCKQRNSDNTMVPVQLDYFALLLEVLEHPLSKSNWQIFLNILTLVKSTFSKVRLRYIVHLLQKLHSNSGSSRKRLRLDEDGDSERFHNDKTWSELEWIQSIMNENINLRTYISEYTSMIYQDNSIVVAAGLDGLLQIFLQQDSQIINDTDGIANLVVNEAGWWKSVWKRLCLLRGHEQVVSKIIGAVGAIDYIRLESNDNISAMNEVTNVSIETKPCFIGDRGENLETVFEYCARILEHFALDFAAGGEVGPQAILAFTMQELVKFCGYSLEIVEGQQKTKNRADATPENILASRWSRFPSVVQEVLKPLIATRYHYPPSIKPLFNELPVFNRKMQFVDWLPNLCLKLVSMISDKRIKTVFELCEEAILGLGVKVAQRLFPDIFLNVLLGCDSQVRDKLLNELEAVLKLPENIESSASRRMEYEDQQSICIQTIFSLMDYINLWRVETIKGLVNGNGGKVGLDFITGFVEKIDRKLLVLASLHCKSYSRALLHQEQIVRKSSEQVELSVLQRIYASLDEADSLLGMSTMINNPTLNEQILSFEVAGSWPAAQACYEILLQRDDCTENQLGLLKCLQNMGHYQSMITYAKGIKSEEDDARIVNEHITIAGWRLGDWNLVKQKFPQLDSNDPEVMIGGILLSIKNGDDRFDSMVSNMRMKLMAQVSAASMESYNRAYDAILQLSLLHEIEEFRKKFICGDCDDISQQMVLWEQRLQLMAPQYKARESVLNLRRILIGLIPEGKKSNLNAPPSLLIGSLWDKSAKEARKSEYFQTAFSCILQALELGYNMALFEKSKLLWSQNQKDQAIFQLDKALKTCLLTSASSPNMLKPKATLKLLSWMEARNGQHSSSSMQEFIQLTRDHPTWGKGTFLLGRYYNKLYENEKHRLKELSGSKSCPMSGVLANMAFLVCKQYGKSLAYGGKYLYQTLPRMLTVWLDLGVAAITRIESQSELEKINQKSQQANTMVSKLMQHLPAYQFLSAIPQLVSRICHPNPAVHAVIESLIVNVLIVYPHQTLWHLIAVAKTTVKNRSNLILNIFRRVQKDNTATRSDSGLTHRISLVQSLADQLISLCNFKVDRKISNLSMSRDFRKLQKLISSTPPGGGIIIPLQSSLTANLPSVFNSSHRPFENDLPLIESFGEHIQVLNSLQRPKKIVLVGSDGRNYNFLCKPDDDLRKDSRMMELNSILNKLLKKDSKGHIGTYAVVPLSERCGLIEWVNGMDTYRNILQNIYKRKNLNTNVFYSNEFQVIKDAMSDTTRAPADIFTNTVLPKFPPVFREWFLESFSDPSKWLLSRNSYTSSTATMSMVGYISGLGDRHSENLLYSEEKGEILHVDLNCLFEKGLEFEVPERVPFRLTHNMVDAFGVYGVEGPFRKCCEVSMRVLHDNRELLMSVLETFLHDPLCEWSKIKNRIIDTKSENGSNPLAIRAMTTIDRKLQGYVQNMKLPMSITGQVDYLIKEATSAENLSKMYIGWAAFL